MSSRRAEAPITQFRVVVYGGDLAALETALTLRRLGRERCRVMLMSPIRDLPVRTDAAGTPPAAGRPARFDLGALAEERGLEFRSDAIVAVDPEAREARAIGGARVRYDALVVAFGARPRSAIPGATTCWGAGDAGALEGLLDELRVGSAREVVFAVARGIRWTLPTYELALTVARQARHEGLGEVRIAIVTYEARAVELLGPEAGAAVGSRLDEAEIDLVTGSAPVSFAGDMLTLVSGAAIPADTVLALPVVEGPRIGGLPRDADGFLPVDAFGRVQGAPRIWAAGDVTSFPVRQAGIAAQQAHVVATSIAAEAGIEVDSEPFRPVVQGLLRSPGTVASGGRANGNHTGGSTLLWWPPEQLAGEHLSAHIAAKLPLRPPSGDDSIPVAVELGPDGRRLASSH